MSLLSVVVPCYNEEAALPVFAAALAATVRSWRETDSDKAPDVELILIDDGSSDGTLAEFHALSSHDDLPYRVRWRSFSRNFGKEAGLIAGLETAHGDFVATMDADMQDPPSLLPDMYRELIDSDWDNVATRRVNRAGEPPIRSAFARLFYRLINGISQTEVVDGARDFRLMRRSMVDAVISLRERNRFSKGIFGWVGFKTKWFEFVNVERAAGETHWSFWSLAAYAMDGIVAFSTVPLSIASFIGIFMCLASVVAVAFIVVRALLFGDPVSGWPSLMCAVVFIGGVQLLCLGIIGQYLAKTYIETKQRPLYIIRSSSDE